MTVLRLCQLVGCLVLATCPAGTAKAQDCPMAKVKVTLVVILASEEGDTVDKRLKAIAAELRIKNPKLTSFQLKSMEDKSMAKEEKAEFVTVDSKKVKVQVKQCANKNNKVCLAVTVPDQGEIVYESTCGKFLPIVTGYLTANNERLILAIRVQPCKGE